MSKNRRIARITLSALFSGCLIGIGIWLVGHFTHKAYTYTQNIIISEAQRVKSTDVSKMTLSITPDTTLDDIATALYNEGCITNKDYFILEAKLDNITKGFIPGDYSISSNMSTGKILDLLTTDISIEDQTIKFTIPEGYTIEQIGEVLEEKSIVTKTDFLNAIKNRNYSREYSFLKDVPFHDDYKYALEGYLFPDTYIVYKGITSEEIIVMMLNRFEEILSRYTTYVRSSQYSIHELLTIASIIEQEARLEEERPIISGVIWNRLDAHMKLQMCSTVQYSLNKRKASLSLNDLNEDSPYNTYIYDGLPIGPICNPGEACLKAALLPSEHDYYFFVLQDAQSGTHCFTSTNEEHATAKNKYRQSNDINFTE
ncbi:MAG: endolytic transglycosylase MltG [Cellulosilyticum sp.]|nr:endolytic transglycosylase MltG [Cellulosilyticum sp.]